MNESIKDVNVTFDNKPKFNCCKRHHMSVLVTAFLACSSLRNYANLQTSFICDINSNDGLFDYVTCGQQYNCTQPPCELTGYACNAEQDYIEVPSKDFHEYIGESQPFRMYCPIGQNGEDVLVAEGYGSCDDSGSRKCKIDFEQIVNYNQTLN
uniref:Uncharacterized protein n=1 Tax=Meloidogyne incognita TaxID=6306 RepID=A0A914L4N2_MELIC